mgnify:CR=1 FL=1
MSTIRAIQNTLDCVDSNGNPRGWVIYYDKKSDKITHIKNLFNPKQYDGSRPIYTDSEIIEILKNEKNNS